MNEQVPSPIPAPTREYDLGSDVAAVRELVAEPRDGEVLMLPDRIGADESGPWVAFRSEAQLVRSAAREAGIPIRLAVPEGYRLREFREHDASLVLPILDTVIGGSALVMSIVQLVLDRRGKGRDLNQRIRIRESVTVETDGERRHSVREWDIPGGVMNERFNRQED